MRNWERSGAVRLLRRKDSGTGFSNPWFNHQALSANGRRLNITRGDFMAVAKAMNVRKAKDIIDQVNET